jgi:hypothetical protein
VSRVWSLVVVLACVCASACEQGSSGGTVVPGGQGSDSQLEPEGSYQGESIDELRLRLERLSNQQQQLSVASSDDPDTCEQTCELSRSICEVKTKMCKLADERPSDSEYQDLCRVAKQRCQQASDSCVDCVQHHQRASGADDCSGDPAR